MKFEEVLPATRAGKIASDPSGTWWRVVKCDTDLWFELSVDDGRSWREAKSPSMALDDGWTIVEERKPISFEVILARYHSGYGVHPDSECAMSTEAVRAIGLDLNMFGNAPVGARVRVRIDELPAQKDHEQDSQQRVYDEGPSAPPAGGGLEGAGTSDGVWIVTRLFAGCLGVWAFSSKSEAEKCVDSYMSREVQASRCLPPKVVGGEGLTTMFISEPMVGAQMSITKFDGLKKFDPERERLIADVCAVTRCQDFGVSYRVMDAAKELADYERKANP